MQSDASTVDEYLETVPADRAAVLHELRKLCQQHLAGYTEAMAYGMPGYSRNGTLEVSFNSQRQYISLYVMNKDVLDAYRHNFKDVGKGCVRYKKPADVDLAIVEQMLKDTAAAAANICP